MHPFPFHRFLQKISQIPAKDKQIYKKMVHHSFGHVFCVLVVIRGLSCCSNPGTVSLDVKTRYSDVIVSGTISAKLGDGKYQMTVDCVLKDSGEDIPASLNISGVGK